jgi:hypothetical protein
LEGLAIEDVVILCGHFINFQVIWYILWPLGIFCGQLVHFPPFWQEQSDNPVAQPCIKISASIDSRLTCKATHKIGQDWARLGKIGQEQFG